METTNYIRKMKITGYENEIWDEKKEIIEELKRAVQEKQKEKENLYSFL